MMRVGKTISVELLRSGPPHNQLVSPLTPYLALCDGHAAATLRLPFEHHDFLLQMQALRYQKGDELPWRARFAQVARDMAEVLRQIPGLATTVGDGRMDGCELEHVEIVLSASELALLPFEATESPSTFASAGLPLTLQTVLPVSLTRRNRRYSGVDVKWPRRPKILVVVASPPGFTETPALAHVMAIRKALAPWISPRSVTDEDSAQIDGAPKTDIKELVTVLDRASLRDLRHACASSETPYTHVHILAHGDLRKEAVGERFTLAFHGTDGQKELVDGRQLAAALRPHGSGGSGSLATPTVVTIASCDSGSIGDVAIPGGSIAHDLHEAGIPFVVASQFPLTFAGSVLLTEVLYGRLLWGDDPRVVLHDVRQQLNLLRHGHDWASIVAYAALPPDLEQQLMWVRAQQARRAAEVALAWFDRASPRLNAGPMAHRKAEVHSQLGAARKRLKEAFPAPERQNDSNRPMLVELHAMLATMDKREAEVLQRCAAADDGSPTRRERELLLSAREHYRKGLRHDRANHWLSTQYLFLSAILQKNSAKDLPEWFTVARFSAREEAREGTPSQRAWAYASLIELCLLKQILGLTQHVSPDPPGDDAIEYAEAMIQLVGMGAFEVHSMRNQLRRYELWASLRTAETKGFVTQLLNVLEPIGYADSEPKTRTESVPPPDDRDFETRSGSAPYGDR